MRVTGGQARGIPLKAPTKGDTRPATDYLREAVFSSLGPAIIQGARVLDTFAGTGAYGLEALSRGAARADFIESDRAALACWARNRDAVAKALGADPATIATHCRGDFFRLARTPRLTRYDLVLADPPYALWAEQAEVILTALADWANEVETARIVCECPGETELPCPPGWTLTRRLAKGPRQPSAWIFARATA